MLRALRRDVLLGGVKLRYERVQHRAGDPEFAAWPQYQAAYWLAVAMGQFRTTREDKA